MYNSIEIFLVILDWIEGNDLALHFPILLYFSHCKKLFLFQTVQV